jgi:hypothetical protein
MLMPLYLPQSDERFRRVSLMPLFFTPHEPPAAIMPPFFFRFRQSEPAFIYLRCH